MFDQHRDLAEKYVLVPIVQPLLLCLSTPGAETYDYKQLKYNQINIWKLNNCSIFFSFLIIILQNVFISRDVPSDFKWLFVISQIDENYVAHHN